LSIDFLPVNISSKTTPKEYTSLRGVRCPARKMKRIKIFFYTMNCYAFVIWIFIVPRKYG
jgi:hypothetical protein